jgi:hypothetical protein
MKALILLLAICAAPAFAEDTTCAVKGMHCESCAEMVHEKVCGAGKYATCDVKIVSEEKELGSLHLVTSDKAAKVDQKAVGAQVKDAGYELDKCAPGAAPAKKGKKS